MTDVRRARRHAQQHPVLALLLAAGAGALLAPELAVGAFIGVGAGLLLAPRTGREQRERLRTRGQALADRGAALSSDAWAWARARLPGRRTGGAAPTTEEGAGQPPSRSSDLVKG